MRRVAFGIAYAGFASALLVTVALAAAPPEPASFTPFNRPGKFITALLAARDALWIGTEDKGLWRLDLKADPSKPDAWRQFPAADTKTNDVYALAQDAAGRLWVGTLNQGVSVYNGKEWRNYGVIDGCSGERVFAIAADPAPKRASVWIGTDHGLTSWTPPPQEGSGSSLDQAGGLFDTPAAVTAPGGAGGTSGGRAPSRPNSPDATKGAPPPPDAGLCPGTWRTYTRADGLPSDQIYAVAVDRKNGRVWVGTECDGLAWSDPPYKKWTAVRAAAEMSGDEGEAPGLKGGSGQGLPSNLTNDLLVLHDGTVAYSTDYGLGIGRESAWTAWQGLSKEPYQNYMRGLAEDAAGGLWIATRHMGLARMDMKTGAVTKFRAAGKGKSGLPDDYVFDVAVTPGGDVWAGTYSGGLARLKAADNPFAQAATADRGSSHDKPTGGSAAGASSTSAAGAAPPNTVTPRAPASTDKGKALTALTAAVEKDISAPKTPPAADKPPAPSSAPRSEFGAPSLLLPAPAAPPTLDELNAMLAQLAKVPFVSPEKQPTIVRLDDDWLTKGDCLGRYGRYWGCWCAICAPFSYVWGAGSEHVEYSQCIGPRFQKGDAIRNWVHWLYTHNLNSLEMPPTYCHSCVVNGYMTADYTRRQAEWDDHGETYPMSVDGPSLYCTLRIPRGLYCLSLYNFNKDGHDGPNRYRDFAISVRGQPARRPLYDIEDFHNRPELARARMRDFWGAAYKRFLVRGPTEITVNVNRNHSFCAILAGVFLDLVDEEPVPYFHTLEEWKALCAKQEEDRQSLRAQTPADRAARFQPASSEAEAAARCFEELDRTRLTNAVWWASEGRRFYAPLLRWTQAALKAAPAGPEKQQLLARATTCQYQLGLYEKWEQGQILLGKTPARHIEKSIRWDGSYSCEGKGFKYVTDCVNALTRKSTQ